MYKLCTDEKIYDWFYEERDVNYLFRYRRREKFSLFLFFSSFSCYDYKNYGKLQEISSIKVKEYMDKINLQENL